MKATLEYTLPEERGEFECAVKALDYLGALQAIREWLRGQRKCDGSAEEMEVLDKIWVEFHELTEGLDV